MHTYILAPVLLHVFHVCMHMWLRAFPILKDVPVMSSSISFY